MTTILKDILQQQKEINSAIIDLSDRMHHLEDCTDDNHMHTVEQFNKLETAVLDLKSLIRNQEFCSKSEGGQSSLPSDFGPELSSVTTSGNSVHQTKADLVFTALIKEKEDAINRVAAEKSKFGMLFKWEEKLKYPIKSLQISILKYKH